MPDFLKQAEELYRRYLATPDMPVAGLGYSGGPGSLQTELGDSGSDLVDFLQTKKGFCQQYAAATAVIIGTTSILGPKFENAARVSVGVVAATVITSARFAGK